MFNLKFRNPFLLRRLIRAHERIASALERIANEYCRTPIIPDDGEDGVEISYARDTHTWELEQLDARKIARGRAGSGGDE